MALAVIALIFGLLGLLAFPYTLLLVLPGLAFVMAFLVATFIPAAGVSVGAQEWRAASLSVLLVLSPVVLPALALLVGGRKGSAPALGGRPLVPQGGDGAWRPGPAGLCRSPGVRGLCQLEPRPHADAGRAPAKSDGSAALDLGAGQPAPRTFGGRW